MKTLYTISIMICMVLTGIASCRLFQNAHYDVSALLTLVSLLSIFLCVAIRGNQKAVYH